MPGYEHLVYEQDGPVTVITINRPDRMNAIGPRKRSQASTSSRWVRGPIAFIRSGRSIVMTVTGPSCS